MRIALGADHAGVDLKNQLKQLVTDRGDVCEDFGTDDGESVDYPDFAARVAREVAAGRCDRGILVCGSGLGMAIAANKVPGIRAVAVTDAESARLARAHNDANVLALGARLTSPADARGLVTIFLETAFSGGRHQRRLDKLAALEQTSR
jgi:ribose 5-phosphate isomerase B